jgi:hypothetical protein
MNHGLNKDDIIFYMKYLKANLESELTRYIETSFSDPISIKNVLAIREFAIELKNMGIVFDWYNIDSAIKLSKPDILQKMVLRWIHSGSFSDTDWHLEQVARIGLKFSLNEIKQKVDNYKHDILTRSLHELKDGGHLSLMRLNSTLTGLSKLKIDWPELKTINAAFHELFPDDERIE